MTMISFIFAIIIFYHLLKPASKASKHKALRMGDEWTVIKTNKKW